tara:strand:- start:1107 stop:1976 length:870 start_codon:yes stop_codon:yes gene_type:complete
MISNMESDNLYEKLFGIVGKNSYNTPVASKISERLDAFRKYNSRDRDSKFDKRPLVPHHVNYGMYLQNDREGFRDGETSDFEVFECSISEFTNQELTSRGDYNQRNKDLINFVSSELDRNSQDRKLTHGTRELLDQALPYVEKHREMLSFYMEQGCDVHESLLSPPGGMRLFKGEDESTLTSGLELARDFEQWVKDGTTTESIEVDHNREYASEQALRVIRAYVSIAEFERFKGNKPHPQRVFVGGGVAKEKLFSFHSSYHCSQNSTTNIKHNIPGSVIVTPNTRSFKG